VTCNPQAIIRIEVISVISCVIFGAICRLGGNTLQKISIVYFGWAVGCAFHLAWMFLTGQLVSGELPPQPENDDPF
jgi:hypothetical protein